MEDAIKHVSTNLVLMNVNVIKGSNSKMTTKHARVGGYILSFPVKIIVLR